MTTSTPGGELRDSHKAMLEVLVQIWEEIMLPMSKLIPEIESIIAAAEQLEKGERMSKPQSKFREVMLKEVSMTQHTPWKLWNGYGPLRNGLWAVLRIGPETGGICAADGRDIVGSLHDLERIVLAVNSRERDQATIAALLEAAKAALAVIEHAEDGLPTPVGAEGDMLRAAIDAAEREKA